MEPAGKRHQKSYFDVLGICCPSEVPLVERILTRMEGVITVSVIVPSRTVIVVHDADLISQFEIEKALNRARLEATVRGSGTGVGIRRKMAWPSPYTLACGSLLLVSFLNPLYRPLKWLAIAAVAAGIPPIVLRSLVAVRRRMVDINILVLIAVAGALALGDYWEAGMAVFLFSIAEWLESRASYEASEVMSSLLSMAPRKATLAESGLVVDPQDVKVDTVLAVKGGEVVPIDGVVVEGKCEVDESSLTGESFPVPKQPQSLVWAGTLNVDGYVSVKTTALAEHSAVAKMTKLVEDAQNSKSRTNKLIDSCSKYYTPAVVLASAAVALVPVAARATNQRYWFHLALVLLVSACPCALVLSTPVATFCALSRAATAGLLIKGGDFLEALAKTKVVAFDKTGTITKADFTVMDFRSVSDEICTHSLLYWVSSIECKSSHPTAAALVDNARLKSVEPKPDDVTEFQTFPGEGVYGKIDGKNIYVGSRRIGARAGCRTLPNVEETMKSTSNGYVFSEAELIGTFSLSDGCRTGAAKAIDELKMMGIKTAMLTGDSKAAACHIHSQLGNNMDFVHAELLPEDKVRIIRKLKSEKGPTVMVGDGMNDAPALMASDVGISMGISGSAVAVETSHATLMSNDVRKIPEAIRLAKTTRWKIVQNIIMSVTTKASILALAFAGHPILWAAVLADVGTCLLVTVNSMLLLRKHGEKGMKCCKPSNGAHRHGCKDHHHEHCRGDHHHREEHRHGEQGGQQAEGCCGMEESCCKSKVPVVECCGSCPRDTNPNGVAAEEKQEACSRSCCHEEVFSPSCTVQEPKLEKTADDVLLITVDSGEKLGKEGDHVQDQNLLHRCCAKEDVSGVLGHNSCKGSACSDGASCSSSSTKNSELHGREGTGGGGQGCMAECRKKEARRKHPPLHQLSEIVTE